MRHNLVSCVHRRSCGYVAKYLEQVLIDSAHEGFVDYKYAYLGVRLCSSFSRESPETPAGLDEAFGLQTVPTGESTSDYA